MNWDNLSNTTPPFIPVPDNDSDTFYFEGIFLLKEISSILIYYL